MNVVVDRKGHAPGGSAKQTSPTNAVLFSMNSNRPHHLHRPQNGNEYSLSATHRKDIAKDPDGHESICY